MVQHCKIALAAAFGLAAILGLAGCNKAAPPVYTLYHNSPLDASVRAHFAIFDTVAGGGQPAGARPLNQDNCDMAAGVLNDRIRSANQGGQPVRYWCEQGPYRP
jgi:hypothetical protein